MLPSDRGTCLSSKEGTWLISGDRDSDSLGLVEGGGFGIPGEGG